METTEQLVRRLLVRWADEPGEATEELRALGSAAIGEVAIGLTDPDRSIRSAAADVLGELRDPGATDALVCALTDPVGSIGQSAANALAELRDPRTIESLEALFGDSTAAGVAIGALGNIGPLAVPSLVRALQHANRRVRGRAAKELGHIGDSRALEPLRSVLSDPEEDVRVSAAGALTQMGRAHEYQAVQELVGEYVKLLNDSDPKVRQHAAQTLAEIGHRDAVGPLIGALEDPIDRVAGSAAWSLGVIGDDRAVDALLACLNRAGPGTRANIPTALGQIGDVRVVPVLVNLLLDRSQDLGIHHSCAYALGELGDQSAVKPLLSILEDPTWGTEHIDHYSVHEEDIWMLQDTVVEALGKLTDPRALPILETLPEAPRWESRQTLKNAIASIQGKIGQ